MARSSKTIVCRILLLASLLGVLATRRPVAVDAFTRIAPPSTRYSASSSYVISEHQTKALYATNDVKPEPDGGEELTAIKTLEGSRMKKMSESTVMSENGSQVYEFWLSAKVEGELVKSLHSEVLKESAKKANFPGFRKGQVPPYAMPQIRGFAVSESIVRTCQSAVDAYGLKSLKGSDGEVNVLEDITELAKTYKLGDDIYFTGTFKATFDQQVAVDTVSDAIDAVADVVDVVEE